MIREPILDQPVGRKEFRKGGVGPAEALSTTPREHSSSQRVYGLTRAPIGRAEILFTGAAWIDPVISLIIVAVILWGSWGLFTESLTMVLQAVPAGIDPEKVRMALAQLPGVTRVHDLHIWPMSTTEAALTAHLVMPGGHPGDAFLIDLQHRLAHDFAIEHTTVQIELGDGAECRMHGGTHAHG